MTPRPVHMSRPRRRGARRATGLLLTALLGAGLVAPAPASADDHPRPFADLPPQEPG